MRYIAKTGNVLLPCPFCGFPAEYDSQRAAISVVSRGLPYHGHSVYCSSPDCDAENGIHETKEEAVTAWNRRAN